jgi:hypothetical protein
VIGFAPGFACGFLCGLGTPDCLNAKVAKPQAFEGFEGWAK